MAGRVVRWLMVALMLISCAFWLISPAMAEVEPLAWEGPGNPPREENHLSETEYQDESIHAVVSTVTYKDVLCHVIDVTIADPTQIRTAVSNDNVKDFTYVKGEVMAKHVNAIAAVNGDFFKYHYKDSYVWRQGEFYYDIRNNNKPLEYLRDVLIIDDQGDFWTVRTATNEKIEAFLAEDFPADRRVINTFTFGPVLVEHGEVQPYTITEFQPGSKMQRVAIAQLDTLTYAIIECDGYSEGTYGLTMTEFAEFIAERYPTCRVAFNLDGGGSTHVIFHDERIQETSGLRNISDILYFASAATGE